jgi:hypothetical protein
MSYVVKSNNIGRKSKAVISKTYALDLIFYSCFCSSTYVSSADVGLTVSS